MMPTAEAASPIAEPVAYFGDAVPTPEQPDEYQRTEEVKRWLCRIEAAEKHYEDDFDRMRADIDFVYGYHWEGQDKLDDDRYSIPLTRVMVAQKVSTLYAKDPVAEARPRQRQEFALWDGDRDTLAETMAQASMMLASGQPLPPELEEFFADVQNGRMRRQLVTRLAKSLEIIYQYFVDAQRPEFKEQMKQLVRRVVITGVGFCRLIWCDDTANYMQPSSVEIRNKPSDRMSAVKSLMARIAADDLDENSPELETLRTLLLSLGATDEMQDDGQLPQRLEFDFPSSTCIIIDPRCRHLKEFVDARWIAQKYILPVAEVNAIFNVQVKVGGDNGQAKEFKADNGTATVKTNESSDPLNRQLVTIYDVHDKTTKTHFFLCVGWHDYLLPPEPVFPNVAGFWHFHALTFNDCEVDVHPDCKASIYPASDVQSVRHVQKEWNRRREALRHHRNANAPAWVVRSGTLSAEDKQKIADAIPNSIVELSSVPAEQPLERFLIARPKVEIDPAEYDTNPLKEDLLIGAAVQQANLGPAQSNITATNANIAEQSRLSVSASNIDDLDGFLSRVAQGGGEMLFRALSPEVAQSIAGPGAAWPSEPSARADFINEIALQIKAASSGRPNKAIDIANAREIVPLLLQAGANPVGVVEFVTKRLDENYDLENFFPLQPTGPVVEAAPAGPQSGPKPPNPQNNR